MKALILGTAGHVDHGKTSLVRALTGVDTDRWKEEKERGLTIDIGFARLDLGPDLEVGVVDVPGHEDFVRNMLVGCTGVDLLLLVVAADEGPMPQTREHLMIAGLLGIRRGVVALTKADRADAEWRAVVAEAVGDELDAYGLGRWPIVEVSSVTGEGVEELRSEIRRAALEKRERGADDAFRLPIDRVFSVVGAGTVVTGTTWSGELSVGDEVRLLPGQRVARVRSLQVHGEARTRVGPGRRCAVSLVGIAPTEVTRGWTLVKDPWWQPASRLGVKVAIPPQAPRGVKHGSRVRFFLGTGEVLGRLLTVDQQPLRQGDTGWAVIELERPVTVRARDRFVLRFYSPVQTVGGGEVAVLEPPSRWRGLCGAWEEILEGGEKALRAVIRLAGGRGVPEDEIPLRTGLPPAASRAIPRGVRRVGDRWYDKVVVEEARGAVLEALRNAHSVRRRAPSEPLETMRASLGGWFSSDLLAAAIADLQESSAIVVQGPEVRLPAHSPRLSKAEGHLLRRMEDALRKGGFEPPSPEQLESELGMDRALRNDLLRLLVASGSVVQVTPSLYLAAEWEARLRTTAHRLLSSGDARGPGAFKEALGVTRKYLIPLLEYLDRIGVTRRTEEGRMLAGGTQASASRGEGDAADAAGQST